MRNDERRLPGEGIPQALFALIHLVERHIRRHFRGTNLHWGLRRILQRLWIQDGLSQKELSAAVGSSKGSISNMLKHLVAGGWVEQRPDDYDYRISRVYLTEQGCTLRGAIEEELDQLDAAVRTNLGGTDAAVLESLLDRSAEALRRASESESVESNAKTLADRPSPPGEL